MSEERDQRLERLCQLPPEQVPCQDDIRSLLADYRVGQEEGKKALAAGMQASIMYNREKERAERAEAESEALRAEAMLRLAQLRDSERLHSEAAAKVGCRITRHDGGGAPNARGVVVWNDQAEALRAEVAQAWQSRDDQVRIFSERLAMLRAERDRLRGKLTRVRDWLKYWSNSEGGIVDEIDRALASGEGAND